MSANVRIERVDERRRIFHSPGRVIYALHREDSEGRIDLAVTYEAILTGHASINTHARTNVTGVMSQHPDDALCEFLDDEVVCWFDGTSLAPAQPDDDAIWATLERWLPRTT